MVGEQDSLCLSTDATASYLASTSSNRSMRIYDARKGTVAARAYSYSEVTTALAFHVNGKHLVTASNEGVMYVFSLSSSIVSRIAKRRRAAGPAVERPTPVTSRNNTPLRASPYSMRNASSPFHASLAGVSDARKQLSPEPTAQALSSRAPSTLDAQLLSGWGDAAAVVPGGKWMAMGDLDDDLAGPSNAFSLFAGGENAEQAYNQRFTIEHEEREEIAAAGATAEDEQPSKESEEEESENSFDVNSGPEEDSEQGEQEEATASFVANDGAADLQEDDFADGADGFAFSAFADQSTPTRAGRLSLSAQFFSSAEGEDLRNVASAAVSPKTNSPLVSRGTSPACASPSPLVAPSSDVSKEAMEKQDDNGVTAEQTLSEPITAAAGCSSTVEAETNTTVDMEHTDSATTPKRSIVPDVSPEAIASTTAGDSTDDADEQSHPEGESEATSVQSKQPQEKAQTAEEAPVTETAQEEDGADETEEENDAENAAPEETTTPASSTVESEVERAKRRLAELGIS